MKFITLTSRRKEHLKTWYSQSHMDGKDSLVWRHQSNCVACPMHSTLESCSWNLPTSQHPLLEPPQAVHYCRRQEHTAEQRAGQAWCYPVPHQGPQWTGNSFREDGTEVLQASSFKHSQTSIWGRREAKGKNLIGQELTELTNRKRK